MKTYRGDLKNLVGSVLKTNVKKLKVKKVKVKTTAHGEVVWHYSAVMTDGDDTEKLITIIFMAKLNRTIMEIYMSATEVKGSKLKVIKSDFKITAKEKKLILERRNGG